MGALQSLADQTLNFYSIPSLALIDSIPSTSNLNGIPWLANFTFSGSGTTVGQLLLSETSSNPGTSPTYSDEISGISGSPDSVLGNGPAVPLLPPDGTLSALPNMVAQVGSQRSNQTQTTNIFKNGALVGAVNGLAVGWIDNNNLLAQTFSLDQNGNFQLSGSIVYNASGATVTTFSAQSLPPLQNPQFLPSNEVYNPSTNSALRRNL